MGNGRGGIYDRLRVTHLGLRKGPSVRLDLIRLGKLQGQIQSNTGQLRGSGDGTLVADVIDAYNVRRQMGLSDNDIAKKLAFNFLIGSGAGNVQEMEYQARQRIIMRMYTRRKCD